MNRPPSDVRDLPCANERMGGVADEFGPLTGTEDVTLTLLSPDSRRLLLEGLRRLHEALERLGDALVTWRLDEVTAAGKDVAAAFEALPEVSDDPDKTEDAVLRDALRLVERALVRCRRLGPSLDELAWRGLRAESGGAGYGPGGGAALSPPPMVLREEA